jgi:cellulose synthase/poly-beta-1,6-N-acetylglucosamine synthase-like glycosyltransferase
MNGSGLQVGVALIQAVALLMSVAFVTYTLVIVVHYFRYRPATPGDGSTLAWHLFVPALNEEKVIGETVGYLRATFPTANVWVIDDDSDDRTGPIVSVRALADPLVHLVSRRAPEARAGKGDALNAAYRALNEWLPITADRAQVIVGVIDADGRPAPNCFDVCAGGTLFGDPAVGSVQVMVRMMNRDSRTQFPHRGRLVNFLGQTLVRLQDLEFRAPISAIQITRRRTRTVGLGGNGQFSRLSALDVVTDAWGRPWRGALLEDYELALQLMMAGHRNEYTEDTYVDQEGLPGLRRLIRQRTRWGQGTMQCGVYLRQLWTSQHVSTLGALEATYYLFQPWLQIAGTLVYPVPIAVFIANYLAGPPQMRTWALAGGWMIVAYYLTIGIGPFIAWGPMYRKRCESQIDFVTALGLGVGYSLFVLILYVTSWRALIRIVRGQADWAKTRRNGEFLSDIEVQSQSAPVGGIQVIREIMGGN